MLNGCKDELLLVFRISECFCPTVERQDFRYNKLSHQTGGHMSTANAPSVNKSGRK